MIKASSKRVVVIDDDNKYRQGLAEFLSREAEVLTFNYPDEFSLKINEPEQLAGVCLVVLDYAFDTFSAFDKDVYSYLREELQYKGPIVLWTLEDKLPTNYARKFDAVLPKKFFSLAEVETCLKR